MGVDAEHGPSTRMMKNDRKHNQIFINNNNYTHWKIELERLLQSRFGIGLGDCFDEFQLIYYFSSGDLPTVIAGDLMLKRKLIDLR